MKFLKLVITVAALTCLTACGKEAEWNILRDGNMFYGKLDGNKEYYWEGSTVGKLPIGPGELVVVKSNGKIAKRIKMEMTYGTDSTMYPYLAIEEGRYLGEAKTKNGVAVPQGFGVLIKDGDSVSYGNFKKGLLDGEDIVVCKNKQIVYKGAYENGVRQGEGEEYIDGKLHYKGSWKNDMKNGEGTLYENEAEVYEGRWKNDQPSNWDKIK